MFGTKRKGQLSIKGTGLLVVAALFVGASPVVEPAVAGGRHGRHDRMNGAIPPGRPVIPYGYSFYPHEIDGGVSGNLPFNNQIRKFRDPLNANGGGG